MPRRPRDAMGGHVYHVLNRPVGRATILEVTDDFAALEKLLEQGAETGSGLVFRISYPGNEGHVRWWDG